MVITDQLQLLGDLDLLEVLCSTHEDGIFYNEFVRRFLPEVEAECKLICEQRKLEPHIGQEIAHDVFEKLRKYKSFRTDEVTASSSHKGILIYLFRIARNLFNDWHNKEKKQRSDYVSKTYFDSLLESIAIPDTPDVLFWKKQTAMTIFGKLNKKEQSVVLADIDYKKHGRYLPDEITENLALSLGIQKSTIRKIRERAIIKIQKAINEINQ